MWGRDLLIGIEQTTQLTSARYNAKVISVTLLFHNTFTTHKHTNPHRLIKQILKQARKEEIVIAISIPGRYSNTVVTHSQTFFLFVFKLSPTPATHMKEEVVVQYDKAVVALEQEPRSCSLLSEQLHHPKHTKVGFVAYLINFSHRQMPQDNLCNC